MFYCNVAKMAKTQNAKTRTQNAEARKLSQKNGLFAFARGTAIPLPSTLYYRDQMLINS